MPDGLEYGLPEEAVIVSVSHKTETRKRFLVLPLGVGQQAKDGGKQKRNPNAKDQPLDESRYGVGASDEASPTEISRNDMVSPPGALINCAPRGYLQSVYYWQISAMNWSNPSVAASRHNAPISFLCPW